MNSTNISLSYHDQNSWPKEATEIINSYVNRTIGAIGIFVNFAFVILLCHKSLNHKVYDFIWCRTFFNLVSCLMAATFFSNCIVCSYESEWILYYIWYHHILLRSISLAQFICDILMIYNRYSEIRKKRNCLSKMSKKSNIIICCLYSFIFSLPLIFCIDINLSKNDKYELKFKDYVYSTVFRIFYFINFAFEYVIPLGLNIYFNIASVKKFKVVMERHGHLTKNKTKARKREISFTKMILILSSITSLCRTIDFVTTSLIRIAFIYSDLIEFIRTLGTCFLICSFAFNELIYLKIDTNLLKLVLKMTRHIKVILIKK